MATENEEWLVVLNSERAVATQSTLVFDSAGPLGFGGATSDFTILRQEQNQL